MSKKRRVRRSQQEPSLEVSKKPEPSLKTTGVNMKKLAASYADPRAAVEEYAEENEEHRNQTDKAIDSVMECVEKINKARVQPYQQLHRLKLL
ncbi:hypothetical protein Tco_0051326 [Tanacetum coccineum]